MRTDLTYCDFLILAPLTHEVDALERALTAGGWQIDHVASSDYPRTISATLVGGGSRHFQRHVTIIQLNHQGVLNASVDTARALELYEPGYVVSFGISGSLSEDAPLGAVVLATSLVYYEPSKDKGNETTSRMAHIPVGETLLNRFRQLRRSESVKAEIADGPVASGEKLVADINSADRKRILAGNDKTLCVEMEAAGVGRAVAGLCPNAEFAVLKGISDPADRSKSKGTKQQRHALQVAAATNAADVMVKLVQNAPLRRVFRALPRNSDEDMAVKANEDLARILDALQPFDIQVNSGELYRSLYGRRGPIPAYYHWRQSARALHWVDFKILNALKSLPKDIVTPIPLVTLCETATADGSWRDCVIRLLGIQPTTQDQILTQQEDLSHYVDRLGLTRAAEAEVRRAVNDINRFGSSEMLLGLMRYMLGQLCHRRLFVFTWKTQREKWEHLSRAYGVYYTIFDWDTIELAGALAKRDPPGRDILIESDARSVRAWLETRPGRELLLEFIRHFKWQVTLEDPWPASEEEVLSRVEALVQSWQRLFE